MSVFLEIHVINHQCKCFFSGIHCSLTCLFSTDARIPTAGSHAFAPKAKLEILSKQVAETPANVSPIATAHRQLNALATAAETRARIPTSAARTQSALLSCTELLATVRQKPKATRSRNASSSSARGATIALQIEPASIPSALIRACCKMYADSAQIALQKSMLESVLANLVPLEIRIWVAFPYSTVLLTINALPVLNAGMEFAQVSLTFKWRFLASRQLFSFSCLRKHKRLYPRSAMYPRHLPTYLQDKHHLC